MRSQTLAHFPPESDVLLLLHWHFLWVTDGATMSWETSFLPRRSMSSWSDSLPFRERCTPSSWSAFGRQGTTAGWVWIHSKPSVFAARYHSVQPARVVSQLHFYQLSKCCFYSLEPTFVRNPFRSGITQTCCMKLCRRRIRQTSRTWTSMTSLQLVTPAVLRQALALKPKWPTQATAKTTPSCQQSIPRRREPIKSSHMNG